MNFNGGGGFTGYNPGAGGAQVDNMGGQQDYVGGNAGFMPSSQGAASTPEKNSRAERQSLIPCTVRQLLTATRAAGNDDTFMIDGKPLAMVTFVGLIMSAEQTSTNYSFKIDDGTGVIDVRMWLDSGDGGENEFTRQRREQFQPHKYVRVMGSLRAFHEKRSAHAFRMTLIEDFNEITYHMLEVINVHLYNTKGAGNPNADQVIKAEKANLMQQGLGSGFQMEAAPTGAVAPGAAGGFTNNNAAPMVDGLNAQQQQVLNIIQRNTNEAGPGVSEILQQLNHSLTEMQVRQAIDHLNEEGLVYSTIDDDHFKYADTSA